MLRIFQLLTLCLAITLFSCTEPDLKEEINKEAVLTSGEWNILMFFDENGDKARDFTNYTFTFKSGGVITASKTNINTTGSWRLGVISENNERIIIDFTDTPFENLDNEWIIHEITSKKIELVKFGDNGTENLLFTKL